MIAFAGAPLLLMCRHQSVRQADHEAGAYEVPQADSCWMTNRVTPTHHCPFLLLLLIITTCLSLPHSLPFFPTFSLCSQWAATQQCILLKVTGTFSHFVLTFTNHQPFEFVSCCVCRYQWCELYLNKVWSLDMVKLRLICQIHLWTFKLFIKGPNSIKLY